MRKEAKSLSFPTVDAATGNVKAVKGGRIYNLGKLKGATFTIATYLLII
jgi:hypothetical protein